MKIDQVNNYLVLDYVDNMYFMLLSKNIIILIFQLMYMHAYQIHTLYYTHIVDTYRTAVYINVYMIMFNVYIIALACFDGYARAATLSTDSSCSDY